MDNNTEVGYLYSDSVIRLPWETWREIEFQ